MTQFEALARNAEKVVQKVIAGANEAGRQTALDTRAFAIYFSSGTTTTAERIALNYPYGLGSSNKFGPRGPIPYGDAAIINSLSGQFKDDWITYVAAIGIGKGSGLITYGVKNVDPIAHFLQFGTSKMIARPLDKAMRVYMDQVYAKRISDTIPPIMQGLYAK